MSKFLFPLPYDGSELHNASWRAAQSYEGKQVEVVLADGSKIRGRVHRAELGRIGNGFEYGAQLRLICGSERFPYDKNTGPDMRSIMIVGE